MRRRYTRERYLEIVAGLKATRPGLTVSTDLIVGFPGETEGEFEETLDLIRRAGFVDSFSFKYSPRPGTAAADMAGAVPADEAQRRLLALQSLQREQTLAYHRSRVGERTTLLVDGESRRGEGQVCGRDPHHRVVNVSPPEGMVFAGGADPGDLLEVELVEATPHSLIGVPVGLAQAPETGDPASESRASAVKLRVRVADERERRGEPQPAADPLRVIG